jgi:uncharacterized RDD family membrane protein YckC
MDYSLQKASIWKRAAAWLLDAILVCILATGFGFLLSSLLDYDSYNRTLNDGYSHYEELYGVSFEISYEEHEALSSDARQNWDNAYNALIGDEDVMYAYSMVINLTMIIVTIGILLGVLVLEFAVPLFLGNGQTLGKKMFGICLMRTDGVRINSLQLLTRTLLGKYTVETMIPVFSVLMLYLRGAGIGIIILGALAVAQLVCLCVTRTNSALHDLMAGTVAVDKHSQQIFESQAQLIEHQKKLAAEKAARQTY